MIFWFIFILLLLIIFFVPIRCTISANMSGMQIKLKLIFFSIPLPVQKKSKKQSKKEEDITQKPQKDPDIKKQLRILCAAKQIIISSIKKILNYVAKHAITVEDLTLNAKIGTGDPADTGMLCGGIYSFAYSAIGALSAAMKLKKHSVQIEPDFDNLIFDAKASTTLKTRIIHMAIVVSLAADMAIRYMKIKRSYERSLNKDHEKRSK